MSFLETPRFPTDISYGSRGGPEFRTTVVELWSGHEQRNADWAYPRHRYDVRYGLRRQEDVIAVLDYFWAVGGRAHSFRYKDWMDWTSGTGGQNGESISSIDQVIGTGDAIVTTFQLIKTYTRGAMSWTRNIAKPVSGTVTVAIDGVTQASGWSVDTTTGIVTFSAAPGVGLAVTAGYHFDVPVRFESDMMSLSIDTRDVAGSDITLVEVRE